jgi:hypothetical protein
MLGISDGVTDNILEEDLEDTTCLLVNETRNTLHTPTAGEATDSLASDMMESFTG